MWIRIQDQRLKDSQIVEYKGKKQGYGKRFIYH